MPGKDGVVASPIKLDEVIRGLFVAWRLFVWDRKAVALIDDSPGGALRSFWCALLILPLIFINWALQAATPSKVPGNFGVLLDKAGLERVLIVLAIFYVIRWTAWPLIMYWLAPLLGSGQHYFRYLSAFNWSRAIATAPALIYAVINFSGIVSGQALAVVSLALLTVMWVYHWFILRTTLEMNGVLAAVLVAAEFILAAFLDRAGIVTII
jgi:hypothetical protein